MSQGRNFIDDQIVKYNNAQIHAMHVEWKVNSMACLSFSFGDIHKISFRRSPSMTLVVPSLNYRKQLCCSLLCFSVALVLVSGRCSICCNRGNGYHSLTRLLTTGGSIIIISPRHEYNCYNNGCSLLLIIVSL